MIADSEKTVEDSFPSQILDRNHEYYGGFCDSHGLVEAKYAIYKVTTMAAVYVNTDSRMYRSPELEKRIGLALDYIAAVQHDNGLFDYIDCNFLSAPDTAFCIKRLLPAYKWLDSHLAGYPADSPERQMHGKMKKIIIKGAQGMLAGGFHTPNHRWAIASNLMDCAVLFNRPEFTQGAEKYLREGIDCNSDGEYAEKSSGNYNRINNDAMLTIARITGDKRYSDNAVRNLRMMLTYIEPDGSIFTANSTRQDNGALVYPVDYYMEYLAVGCDYNIPEFLDMTNTIFDIITENRLAAPDFLMHLMNRPDLIALEHTGRYMQPDFCTFYRDSGISRTHSGNFTWTLLQGKSNFLYFTNKSLVMEMKIAGSFCEHRAFQAEYMHKDEKRKAFSLEQTMHGWYYLPFEQKPETSDWWKMDNAARRKLPGPDLHITVSVEQPEGENGIDVHMKLEGVKPAPFRVEIACTGAETVSGEQFEIPAVPGGAMIGKEGMITFDNGKEHISVGPAFGTHKYTAGKFGSEKASTNCFSLYFTDSTPFGHVIKIRT